MKVLNIPLKTAICFMYICPPTDKICTKGFELKYQGKIHSLYYSTIVCILCKFFIVLPAFPPT